MAAFFEWELDVLQWLSEHRGAFADALIHVLNFTGDIMFFSIALPLLYWIGSKRYGIHLAMIVFTSFYANVYLKDFLQIQRPFQAHGDRIIPLIDQHGYSFPSGHAQHSSVFWGFIASRLRQLWVYAAAAFIILAIGFARVYSGVHYPKDVLLGWLIGILIVLLASYLIKKMEKVYFSNALLVGIAVLVPAVFLLLYQLTAAGRLDQEGAYQASGLVAFTILGFVWERVRIRFVIPAAWSRRLIACLIGLIGLLIIKEGFKLILPEHYWSDFFRYGLIGFWTIAVAPWLFVRLKLYNQQNHSPSHDQRAASDGKRSADHAMSD